jgi:hypothetical protein
MPVRSTKMDVCARLCAHYLTHDQVDNVSFVDGKPVFPEIVVTPGHPLQKTRRIIIFQEFSSMALLLQNVRISSLISFMSDTISPGFTPLWGPERCHQWQDPRNKARQGDKGLPRRQEPRQSSDHLERRVCWAQPFRGRHGYILREHHRSIVVTFARVHP